MQTDLVIIGAGLAGSCLAAAVAQRGWQVLLLERQRAARHKVCGEFLSPESQASLHALGLHATVAGLRPAHMQHATLVSRRGQHLALDLPGTAWGISRYALDPALADAAAAHGAIVQRGVTGTATRQHHGGFQVDLRAADGTRSVIDARTAVVACGRHAVPGLKPHTGETGRAKFYVGVKCHYVGLPRANDVKLYLFDGGYVGLSPIEAGRANLCLLATEAAFARAGKQPVAMLDAVVRANPALAQVLAGGTRLDETIVTVAAVDTGRPTVLWDGCARLGDAATMIPPLCGDGQAMAIHAAALCAPLVDEVLAGQRTIGQWQAAYSRAWHAEYDQPLRTARRLQALLAHPQISEALLGAGRLLPTIAQQMVLATRGAGA